MPDADQQPQTRSRDPAPGNAVPGPQSQQQQQQQSASTSGAFSASQRPRPGQQRQQQSQQQQRPRLTAAQQAAQEAREKQAELRYYTQQIYMIIKPVIVCILLSVLWVKLSTGSFGIASDYRPQRSSFATYTAADPSNSGQQMSAGLINALIILSQIILATIIFVVLFKFGCWKILYGYLFLTVVLLLGFMSFLLLLSIVQVLSIPMDYVTLAFILYNFSVTGIMTIFWRGPLWLQQAYLVVMSSLMAFALTGLDEWTTWILLAVLAIWDLVAVLCPFGPLKILVESSREQNRDIPALLYSVNMVYFMAQDTKMDKQPASADEPNSIDKKSDSQADQGGEPAPSSPRTEQLKNNAVASDNQQQRPPSRSQNNAAAQQQQQDEDEESGGLKLGLGDFVFYSVLIARTALYDWVTTMSCIIAVLMGLNLTILLLAIYRKALPALPISIAFGLVFYFVSAKTLVPMCNWMAVHGVLV